MFFTLGVSAATPEGCAALTGRALAVDPSVMPVPGPAEVAWRSPEAAPPCSTGAMPPRRARRCRVRPRRARRLPRRHDLAGTPEAPGGRVPLCARTSVTRVDPVYLAEVPGAVIVADRATWAAWTSSRLDDHDPLHLCALLNPGFPLGSVTPFTGVTAVAGSTTLRLLNGSVTRAQGAARALGRRLARRLRRPQGRRRAWRARGTSPRGLSPRSRRCGTRAARSSSA